MAEPTTTTFVISGVAAAALGPVLGPWALICFGAFAGSLLAMGRTPTPSVGAGVWFVLTGIAVATAFTGLLAWLLEKYLGVPTSLALMPVSGLIGAGRSALLTLIEQLFGMLAAAMGKRGGQP